MAVRVPWADSSSIFPVSPSRDFHRSARCTQSTRERAVLAPIEDVMKLIGISSYPRRKGDAMKKLALALTLACLLGPASTHAQNVLHHERKRQYRVADPHAHGHAHRHHPRT